MEKVCVSRRGFLKRTAGASLAVIGLPYLVRSSARGKAGPVAASERITIGFIGTGDHGRNVNIKNFLSNADAQAVAVCDVDPVNRDAARDMVNKKYGNSDCATYKDFRDVLARADIDAVMVSTPDHWHVPISIAAVKAGKDVSCEKPLTLCIEEGRILSDTVRRYNRVFRTDSEFRSHACFQRTCELVLSGRIGKVHTIRTGVPVGDVAGPVEPSSPVPEELDYEMWLGPAPAAPYTVNRVHEPHKYERPGWMRVRDYCEGMVTNWGAHLNDIAQWGNGTDRTGPIEVEGTGTYPRDGLWGVLLGFDIQYKYANGVQLFYNTSRPYVRFEGSEGWIEADYETRAVKAQPQSILDSPLKPDDIHLPLKDEKRDFIDAVKTRGPTLEDAEVGHRTTSLCQIGHIAIQVGHKLHWDPQAERFTNDDVANRLLGRPMRSPWILT